MYSSFGYLKPFSQISYSDYKIKYLKSIKNEINSKTKDYILGVDDEEYQKFLIQKFTLEKLNIDIHSESYRAPSISRNSYYFEIMYNFTGSIELFTIRPNPHTLRSYQVNVNKDSNKVSFELIMNEQNAERFKLLKNKLFQNAFSNLDSVNENIKELNSKIPDYITNSFSERKNYFLKENDFFSKIDIRINNETKNVFSIPTIAKKFIPQEPTQKIKEYTSEPTMDFEIYNDLINVIYTAGKSIEKKPSMYKGKDEESLRELFLFLLETRYKGVTATGETFNKIGKTDILLKYANDGTILFVGECKIWHGAVELSKAVDQLFDRYLTWRDSKVALIIFVQNKGFTNVLKTIKSEIVKHKYFIKSNGEHGESSFSYIFRLPQDEEKEVYLELIAFHYN
jgi:hypothetical protein